MSALIPIFVAVSLLTLVVSLTTGSVGISTNTVRNLKLGHALPAELGSIQMAAGACSSIAPSGDNGSTGSFRAWPGDGVSQAWAAVATLECPGNSQSIWTGYLKAPTGWEYRITDAGPEARVLCPSCTDSVAEKLGGAVVAGYFQAMLGIDTP